jgi:hypothetical protein
MKNKHYSHVIGYRVDKLNFIAINIGHQAMTPDKQLIMTGDNQSTRMCISAKDVYKLKEMAGELMIPSFADKLIELQNSWHLDFTREFKVSLGDM